MKKHNLTTDEIIHYLKNVKRFKNNLYQSNTINYINLKKDGDIETTINYSLIYIINSLDNELYYFKYAIYDQEITSPFFAFLTKKDLNKHIHIKELKNYPYNIFGIRFEFIDTESNRYIYIVTIS